MTGYYLVHYDESDGSWSLLDAADGSELRSWSSEPDKASIRGAFVSSDLPENSNLPDAARYSRATGLAIAADYSRVNESHPRFPFW